MTDAQAAGNDIDPQIRRFQAGIAAGYARFPGFESLPLPEARLAAEQVRAPWAAGGPVMARTRDLTDPARGTRFRIHLPQGAPDPAPALVYVHGGGWMMFSIDTHDRLMREYAARAGVAVVGIDYSLSPEAKFPAALEEILSLVALLRRDSAAHGLDPARLAIGGDSAGANLAVAANLALRDRGLPPLAAMLLNYGAFDPAHTASYARYGGPAYTLNPEEMDLFWRNYTRDEADLADPLVVPTRADLAGLPPAFLAVAECDILADCNHQLAARLRAAGVDTTVASYPGATHSFLEAVSIADLSGRAFDEAAAWLRARLFP